MNKTEKKTMWRLCCLGIEAHEIERETEKSVWVVYGDNKHAFRELKSSNWQSWYDSKEEAILAGLIARNEEIRKYETITKSLIAGRAAFIAAVTK